MKKIIFTIVSINLCIVPMHSQKEKLEVQGAIQIGNSEDSIPEAAGTIRWNGFDFEGWNGVSWVSLTRSVILYDIDSNRYTTVQIGGQIWMSENLRVTHYNDGTPILLVSNDSDWSNLTTPAYAFNSDASYDYGPLYNYYTVADTNRKNVCPIGWQIPSDSDWTVLVDFLGGSLIAGGEMKEMGFVHWQSPNTGATNRSGFNGLPGGRRNNTGSVNLGIGGYFWSSSDNDVTRAWNRTLFHIGANVNRNLNDKKSGFSIRCIKGEIN